MMKKFYISDLDGTLLNPYGEVTSRSFDILNTLLSEGMDLTFATARTASTALKILEGIPLQIPVILMNGVAVYDTRKSAYTEEAGLQSEQSLAALEILANRAAPAFVYTIEENQLFCYNPPFLNESMRQFRLHREERYSKKFTDISRYEELAEEKIIYFTLVGSKSELTPVYKALSSVSGLECLLYEDVYEDDWFLEVHRNGVSKGTTALKLKDSLQAGELIVFGDNLNDLPLFAAADYRFATANGKEAVRQAADQIIGPNTHDSVAEELWRLWEQEKRSFFVPRADASFHGEQDFGL